MIVEMLKVIVRFQNFQALGKFTTISYRILLGFSLIVRDGVCNQGLLSS